MKKSITILSLLILASCGSASSSQYSPRNGDIIFHTSRSSQSLAIQRATHSPYSHMGVVYIENGEPFVYEAIQPVKLTPLADWIQRGEGGHYVVKRLREADLLLTPENLARMKTEGEKLKGKSYDLYFEWSDERIYCSELVFKVYQRALGIEIGKTGELEDFDLSDPAVSEKVKERWVGPPPRDELVISPAAMFDSELLVTVFSE